MLKTEEALRNCIKFLYYNAVPEISVDSEFVGISGGDVVMLKLEGRNRNYYIRFWNMKADCWYVPTGGENCTFVASLYRYSLTEEADDSLLQVLKEILAKIALIELTNKETI